MAVEQRFDHMAGDGLDDEEQERGGDDHRPAGIHRSGQDQGQKGADRATDIGHEAQDRRQHAEQDRTRHPDEPEAGADDRAEGDVEGELRQEEPAQPTRGVVDGRRGAAQVAGAGEPDGAVPQVLPLQQDEDREEEDQAGGGERVQDGPDEGTERRGEGSLRGRDHHVEGVGTAARSARKIFVLRGRGLQFLAEVLHHVDDARQGSAARGRLLHRGDLLADGDLVARQVGGELARLGGDEQPDPDDRRESRHHHEGRRRGARHHRPPQHAHGGHQDEAEEDRQDHGYDDVAGRNTASTRW